MISTRVLNVPACGKVYDGEVFDALSVLPATCHRYCTMRVPFSPWRVATSFTRERAATFAVLTVTVGLSSSQSKTRFNTCDRVAKPVLSLMPAKSNEKKTDR